MLACCAEEVGGGGEREWSENKRERERDRERQTKRQRQRERKTEAYPQLLVVSHKLALYPALLLVQSGQCCSQRLQLFLQRSQLG